MERKGNEMKLLLDRFSEYICDQLCKWPEKISDPEELEEHCMEHCEHGSFHCSIPYQYNRVNDFGKSEACALMKKYHRIVLCKDCVYRKHEETGFDWCRLSRGLDESLEEYEGYSRGKEKE